jgi:hypothetical protein
MKELELQRRRLRPTGSTGTSDRVTLSLTEPHRVTRAQVTGSTYLKDRIGDQRGGVNGSR